MFLQLNFPVPHFLFKIIQTDIMQSVIFMKTIDKFKG